MPEVHHIHTSEGPFTIQALDNDDSEDLIQLLDPDGIVVFSVNREGDITTGGGGGGAPPYLTNASYLGDPVGIANGATNNLLTFDTLGSGSEILDRTNPEEPEVLEEGIYAVTASVEAVPLTAGGAFHAILHLDFRDVDSVCEQTIGADAEADGRIVVCLSNTYYIPEGGVIAVTVSNFDGASARNFSLRECLIQKIA